MYQQILEDVLKKVRNKNKREKIQHLTEALEEHKFTKYISEGANRRTFNFLSSDAVIKIAKSKADLANNEEDVKISQASDFVADIIDWDEQDFIWYVQEKCHVLEEYSQIIDAFKHFRNNRQLLLEVGDCFTNIFRSYVKYHYTYEKFGREHALKIATSCQTARAQRFIDDVYQAYLGGEEGNNLKRAREFFLKHTANIQEFTCLNIGINKRGEVKTIDPSIDPEGVSIQKKVEFELGRQDKKSDNASDRLQVI